MKKSKKKFIIIMLLIMILASIILPTTSIATENTVTLYGTHVFGDLLSRNGTELRCIYIVYNKDGVEYPSYCLNEPLAGATLNFSYEVNTDNLITDMELWRTVVNGYPYKTPEELGCQTKEEAYFATRHAIYCSIYDRDPDSYKSMGTAAGDRTLAALKQIVTEARNGTYTKPSSTITIDAKSSMWNIDSIDKNYVSKEFAVTAGATVKDYTVKLSGNLVEGIKVTDLKNEEKSYFSGSEEFKILIPIKNIKEDGNFSINVNGDVATKPVIHGIPVSDSSLQDTAITGLIYEAGAGAKTEYYFKNETKVKILKQDQETKKPLQGVKFQILDENKEVVYSGLVTDEFGSIVVENLLPGKYYVQETETLENYHVYDKLIEINLKLNEETTITVNNLHDEDIPKIEKQTSKIELEQERSEVEVKQEEIDVSVKEETSKLVVKLPKTGM